MKASEVIKEILFGGGYCSGDPLPGGLKPFDFWQWIKVLESTGYRLPPELPPEKYNGVSENVTLAVEEYGGTPHLTRAIYFTAYYDWAGAKWVVPALAKRRLPKSCKVLGWMPSVIIEFPLVKDDRSDYEEDEIEDDLPCPVCEQYPDSEPTPDEDFVSDLVSCPNCGQRTDHPAAYTQQ